MTLPCESGPRFSDFLGYTGAITVPGVLEDVSQSSVCGRSLDPSCCRIIWLYNVAVKKACMGAKRMTTKIRAQVNLSEEVVRQIDAVVGPRKRSEFLERAAIAQLRREALDRWMELGEKFKGLTLDDVYYPSRVELEERGG